MQVHWVLNCASQMDECTSRSSRVNDPKPRSKTACKNLRSLSSCLVEEHQKWIYDQLHVISLNISKYPQTSHLIPSIPPIPSIPSISLTFRLGALQDRWNILRQLAEELELLAVQPAALRSLVARPQGLKHGRMLQNIIVRYQISSNVISYNFAIILLPHIIILENHAATCCNRPWPHRCQRK